MTSYKLLKVVTVLISFNSFSLFFFNIFSRSPIIDHYLDEFFYSSIFILLHLINKREHEIFEIIVNKKEEEKIFYDGRNSRIY